MAVMKTLKEWLDELGTKPVDERILDELKAIRTLLEKQIGAAKTGAGNRR